MTEKIKAWEINNILFQHTFKTVGSFNNGLILCDSINIRQSDLSFLPVINATLRPIHPKKSIIIFNAEERIYSEFESLQIIITVDNIIYFDYDVCQESSLGFKFNSYLEILDFLDYISNTSTSKVRNIKYHKKKKPFYHIFSKIGLANNYPTRIGFFIVNDELDINKKSFFVEVSRDDLSNADRSPSNIFEKIQSNINDNKNYLSLRDIDFTYNDVSGKIDFIYYSNHELELYWDPEYLWAFKTNEQNSLTYIKDKFTYVEEWISNNQVEIIANKLGQQDYIFRKKINKFITKRNITSAIEEQPLSDESYAVLDSLSINLSDSLLSNLITEIYPLPSFIEHPYISFKKQQHETIDKAKNASKLFVTLIKSLVLFFYEEMKEISVDSKNSVVINKTEVMTTTFRKGDDKPLVEEDLKFLETFKTKLLGRVHTDGSWLGLLRSILNMPKSIKNRIFVFDPLLSNLEDYDFTFLDNFIKNLNRYKHEPFDHRSLIDYADTYLPDFINGLRPAFSIIQLYYIIGLNYTDNNLFVKAKSIMGSSEVYKDVEFQTTNDFKMFPTNKLVAYNKLFDKVVIFDELIKIQSKSIETFEIKLFDRKENGSFKYE